MIRLLDVEEWRAVIDGAELLGAVDSADIEDEAGGFVVEVEVVVRWSSVEIAGPGESTDLVLFVSGLQAGALGESAMIGDIGADPQSSAPRADGDVLSRNALLVE